MGPSRCARNLLPSLARHPSLTPTTAADACRVAPVVGRRPCVAVGRIFSEILAGRYFSFIVHGQTDHNNIIVTLLLQHCYAVRASRVTASAEKQTRFPRKPSSRARTAVRIIISSLSLAAVGYRALSSSYDRTCGGRTTLL